MSNLLPEKAQQKIRNEYRARFVMTGSALAIAAALFTALAISPSFAALYVSRPATAARATEAQKNKQDSEDIASARMLISQISPLVTATSTASKVILAALSHRPEGVHIDDISYASGAAPTISIGGVADSRVVIDKYRTSLQADPLFTSVKLPVGDLVGRDGRFTITLSGKF